MPTKKTENKDKKPAASPERSREAKKTVARLGSTESKRTKKTAKKATSKKIDKDESEVSESKKRVRHSYLFAVGRRKKAISRTRLFKKGTGKIIVNEKAYDKYFPTFQLQQFITQPLEAVGKLKEFDFTIKVQGGGPMGQAVAVRHGISRALLVFDQSLRTSLKPHGYLTRDPRRKERKKPGLKRARRAGQFSKR